MITIAICDDDSVFRGNLNKCCCKFLYDKGIEFEVKEYESPVDILKGAYPDVLLTDTNMKEINGLFLKEILGKMQAKTRILFISANKNVMREAFGKNVYGFLCKPARYEQLCGVLEQVINDVREEERFIYCHKDNLIHKVPLKKVMYIEASGRFSRIYEHDIEGYLLSQRGIRQWQDELKESHFVLCHRKYLVNMLYINKLEDEVELLNKIRLPLSRQLEKYIQMEYENFKTRIRKK